MSLNTQFHEFLRSRRSVRRFRSVAIDPDVIERILTTATYAPSAHNRQPWRFAVITEPATKLRLAESMTTQYRADLNADGLTTEKVDGLVDRSRNRLVSAPLVVVLCMDMSEMDQYPDARRADAERHMAWQSVANAGNTLLLAAHAEGLTGVWNCSALFAPQAVVSALDLPSAWEPQALLLIGQSAEAPRARERRRIKDVAVFR